MNFKLSEEYTLKGDTLNYELTDGRVSYFFRTLNEAIDRFLEINRRDKLKHIDGDVECLLTAVKQINTDTLNKLLVALEKC